jgi:hypothetical protein
VGAYGRVLHQALKATASQVPGAGKAYPVLKALRAKRLDAQTHPGSGRVVEQADKW